MSSNVTIEYVRRDRPHVFFHGNSHLFKDERIRARLPEYGVMIVKLSPHVFCVPNKRHICITLLVLRSYAAMRRLFIPRKLEVFRGECTFSAEECFFVASDEEVAQSLSKFASKKGITAPAVSQRADLLSAGDYICLQIHK